MSNTSSNINILVDVLYNEELLDKRNVYINEDGFCIKSFLDMILTQISEDRKQKLTVMKVLLNNKEIDVNMKPKQLEKILSSETDDESVQLTIKVKRIDDDWELLDQAYDEIKQTGQANQLSPQDFNIKETVEHENKTVELEIEQIDTVEPEVKDFVSEIDTENSSSHWKDKSTTTQDLKIKSKNSSSNQSQPKEESKKAALKNPLEEVFSSFLKPVEAVLENVINMIPDLNPHKDVINELTSVFKTEEAVKTFQRLLASDAVSQFILDICRNEVHDKARLVEYFKTHLPYFMPEFGKFLQETPEAMKLLPSLLSFLTNKVFVKPKAAKDKKTESTRDTGSQVEQNVKKTKRIEHRNVECDGCIMYPALRRNSVDKGYNVNRRICGHRYKSAVREDFDLCQSCEDSGMFDAEYAPFLKIRHPSKAPKEIICVLKGNKTPVKVEAVRKKPRNKVKLTQTEKPLLEMVLLDLRSSRLGTKFNPINVKLNESFKKDWKVRNPSKKVVWPVLSHLVCIKEYFLIENERFSTKTFHKDKHLACPLPVLANGVIKIKTKVKCAQSLIDKMSLLSRNTHIVNHVSKWRLVTEEGDYFGDVLFLYLTVDCKKANK